MYYASWNPNQKDKFLLPKAWAYTPHHIDSFELVEVVNERRRGMVGGTPLTLDDIRALMGLVDQGVEGAIAGTALYEGRFTLEDALALTRGES